MARNALVTALESLHPTSNGNMPKVIALFGNQPEVLEAIREARRRKCSYVQIAKTLSTPENPISETAIKSWLTSQGIG
jgi:DNA-binding MurR/RpiR family transcriptional regulator